MRELNVVPNQDSAEQAARFMEETLEAEGCPAKVILKMNVAFDELFSNVVRYSGARNATVRCGLEGDRAVLMILDDGRPFDPTKTAEPNTLLSADERSIGGLGIHMVRKLMDGMEYRFSGGQNVLTIHKNLI